ncbi:UNVERIFIED_CONTAM: UTP--glucose-1-phosphate uridylyltransferase 3, chloroplastic [Sesamum radiatum]|uniref:UTP--glucose-1-phosphate uridylyltransferase 3, chloroplastic n=1 Tax=Sesamum radiatum TaxID=300843 RepID=A0AAW2NBY3_SESRA
MIESWDVDGGSRGHGLKDEEKAALKSLLKMLGEVEQFYDCIGGIIGYQATVLELLAQSTNEGQTINWSEQANMLLKCQFVEIHPPSVLDLSEDIEYASQAALWGIEGLPVLGEIYPLGGSADRLGLVDPETGECLPAAMLPYCGRTLLEGLIRDLQAREFLYFKLYGEQCITPVAIMTSSAKNNHGHITYLCERFGWFGRGRSSFQIFEQPLVPAVTAEDGQWIVTRPFEPVCKPGGHGVIWKLAHDKGVFKWFQSHGRKGATVRQISNVVAATDLTLLALAGIEGINVLLEKKNSDGNWAYGFSCIEYTEFDKFGITARPLSPGGVSGGRLECTMQNIADNFANAYSSRCYKGVEDGLDTFIVYNERRKVTSSAKKRRRHGKSLHQVQGNEEYVNSGPPYLILLHPALGPLWEVTRQKFRCGSIAMGSELQIEVAEFLWRNVQGNYVFDVPDGHKMQVTSGISGLDVQLKPIKEDLMDTGTWFWNYKIRGTHIELELIELPVSFMQSLARVLQQQPECFESLCNQGKGYFLDVPDSSLARSTEGICHLRAASVEYSEQSISLSSSF